MKTKMLYPALLAGALMSIAGLVGAEQLQAQRVQAQQVQAQRGAISPDVNKAKIQRMTVLPNCIAGFSVSNAQKLTGYEGDTGYVWDCVSQSPVQCHGQDPRHGSAPFKTVGSGLGQHEVYTGGAFKYHCVEDVSQKPIH